MTKRTYRATDVKDLKVDQLKEQVRDREVVLGVDIAKDWQYATLVDKDRETLSKLKWDQVPQTRSVVDLLGSLPAASLSVVMEPTGTYGDPLRHQLELAGIPVHRVCPKRSKDYSEVVDGVPSQHDPKSAYVLARMHWEGYSEPWEATDEEHADLSAATREVDLFNDQYHRNLSRLEAQLARHWPELTRRLKLTSKTLLTLLVVYGSPQAVTAAAIEARAVMRSTGRAGLKSQKIEQVLAEAAQTLGVPMTSGQVRLLQLTAREAQRSLELRDEASRELKRLTQSIPSVAALAPLLGEATAAVLVSEVDPIAAAHPSAYVKGLGLNLKVHSSGRHQGQLKITKRGSGIARRWLYLAVLRLVQRDPVVKAWYRRKIERDGGVKKKALIAVQRKLAKALWHVARGAEFDASKLFDTRRLTVDTDA